MQKKLEGMDVKKKGRNWGVIIRLKEVVEDVRMLLYSGISINLHPILVPIANVFILFFFRFSFYFFLFL